MAIDDLLDEHEQSERVRGWLRKNGVSILAGVAIAIGGIWGWKEWQTRHSNSLAGANVQYQVVLKSLEDKDLEQAAKGVKELESGKANIYADLAALQLAKAQVDAGKNDDALATLRAIKADPEFKPVIEQRVARLLVATGKTEDAIKQLGTATDSTSLEIHGDALMAQGKRDAAREQYEKALKTLDVAAPQRRLLETKLTDAGGTVTDPAESV
ncbi:putative negative regulator of RcsB-dependent stress response [Stenotrophomonas rhizophila]|jgi:predicted negative regulator of RcsB-dependent stress response|uniref:YfgM family protein n=1 Tax=Stenotrophomonas TaxID=40323 RepID=UPI000F4B42B9|nr:MULTISPECIES: tetratricopeptide repeat protein [Stenotrophomonas]MCW6026459.1 tetratricopeptide repeat protein [Stenotrophomonas sp. SRS1]ROP79962.1 putative negative regulator of RcsB-dependent stress response [Stenotrophomonas rhizophila]